MDECVCLVKAQVFLTQLWRAGSLGDSGEGPGGLFICLSTGGPASHTRRENALRTTAAPHCVLIDSLLVLIQGLRAVCSNSAWKPEQEAAGHGSLQGEGKMQGG